MHSIWTEDFNPPYFEPLSGDTNADVVIIGGGITGLLTAYLLQEQGAEVIVLEAERICSGVTKNTTAKITAQHEIICQKLIGTFGEAKALQYIRVNNYAIEKFEEIIRKKDISCNFERLPNYVYSIDDTHALMFEAAAANRLGIAAEFTTETELPFPVAGAVKFPNQAQFHPLKFLQAIAEDLTIYEKTKVRAVEGNHVITSRGTVRTKKTVMATHFPFINAPGYYFIRMHQERSYVIALEDAKKLDGMYKGIDDNSYSFRNYENLLLFGGSPHRTGKNHNGGCYDRLRDAAEKYYPDSKELFYWSAQDCMTLDNVPYIGQYSASTPDLYVATGFKKWGMTSSMASALMLSDMILGKSNENAEVFSPQRFHLTASAGNLAKEGAEAVTGLVSERLANADIPAEEIKNGHGGIVDYQGEKIGVYKNGEGETFFVPTKCSHLGCQLQWNPDELTWDCPCHGSRFDYKGNLIGGPAMYGLFEERKDVSMLDRL